MILKFSKKYLAQSMSDIEWLIDRLGQKFKTIRGTADSNESILRNNRAVEQQELERLDR
jgi:hypothetical protein